MLTKKLIEEVALNFDSEDLSLTFDYSGRFMYGAQCFGVIASGIETFSLFVHELTYVAALKDDDTVNDITSLLSNLRSDSMGLDSIYYFPFADIPEDDN